MVYYGNDHIDYSDYGNNCHNHNFVGVMYSIEYVDAKKSGSRKRKK